MEREAALFSTDAVVAWACMAVESVQCVAVHAQCLYYQSHQICLKRLLIKDIPINKAMQWSISKRPPPG